MVNGVNKEATLFGNCKNEKVVSVCCSARSTPVAAGKCGNFSGVSRNGYGTDVVTAWAISIQEKRRIPLYSTAWDNFSLQAVAKQTKIINYGMNLHID